MIHQIENQRKSSLLANVSIDPPLRRSRGGGVLLSMCLLGSFPTSRFNEQVKRNLERFPVDFIFQLTTGEWLNLISQNAISRNHGTMLNSTIDITKSQLWVPLYCDQ